jgi:hypothetical protein
LWRSAPRVFAFQRAEIAQYARAQMVEMTKEQVLACMGAPATKAAEAATELGDASGNGITVANGGYDRYGGTAVSSSRFCNVNIVFCCRPIFHDQLPETNWAFNWRRAMHVCGQQLRQRQ